MKRKVLGTLALSLVCALAAFGFTACEDASNGGGDHLHTYEEIVSPEYLKSAATCENAAVYYKSCSGCEAKSEEMFEYGTALGHSYENGVCTECGDKKSESKLEEATGLEYTLSDDETYYIVSGIGRETRTAFAIPSTYNGKPVKEICFRAFYGCSSLRSIEIPESVTSIGWYAFWYCSGLRSVTFGENSALTSIGAIAFYGCSRLTSIEIPAGVTSIGSCAFEYCSSLTSIEIPAGVTRIGENAFEGCRSLTSIEIPAGVTSIGDEAFKGCSSLTSIEIPDSVTIIGDSAFKDCSSLESIRVDENNSRYYTVNNCLIDKACKKLVLGCKNSVIPSDGSVTIIGDSAFDGCSSLRSIEIPDSVTSIGYYAFYCCSSLRSVTFGENSALTSIGYYAFYYCSSLRSVTFGENNALTNIGRYAFSGCTNLQYTVYNNAKYLGNSTNPYVALIEVEDTDISTCAIHEDTKVIAEYAFYRCRGLTGIEIPAGVTSIGYDAFYGCSSLTRIYYTGSAKDWDKIGILDYNLALTSATRYYYSESNPFEGENAVTSGNYWHYDENGEIVVW